MTDSAEKLLKVAVSLESHSDYCITALHDARNIICLTQLSGRYKALIVFDSERC
jgi:hypothetical protein